MSDVISIFDRKSLTSGVAKGTSEANSVSVTPLILPPKLPFGRSSKHIYTFQKEVRNVWLTYLFKEFVPGSHLLTDATVTHFGFHLHYLGMKEELLILNRCPANMIHAMDLNSRRPTEEYGLDEFGNKCGIWPHSGDRFNLNIWDQRDPWEYIALFPDTGTALKDALSADQFLARIVRV